VKERFADLAAAILAAPARLGRVRLVGVDGPAGSGKTTFAARLANAVRDKGVTVVEIHTDDLLEGWTDMVSFWPRLQEWILEPLGRDEPGRYRTYNWPESRFNDEWITLPVPDVLILEGVTAARAEAAPYQSLSVFVRAERDLRLERGIARDGEALREEWLRWMAGEDRHFAADETEGRATLVVNGAPQEGHDPEREYVRVAITPGSGGAFDA
jgi:hypothetical protein